jgi:hypothetical protein
MYWGKFFLQLKCDWTVLLLHAPRISLTYNGLLEKCSLATMSSQVWRLNGWTFVEGNSIEKRLGYYIRRRVRTSEGGFKSCKWCGTNIFFFWRSSHSQIVYFCLHFWILSVLEWEIRAYIALRKIRQRTQHGLRWYAWNSNRHFVELRIF